MALAAIIIADDHDEADGSVLGRPSIEVMLGRAVAAGARHLVVITNRIGPSLLGAADRFRASGVTVDLARGTTDAVERIHPDERLLVMPSNVFVSDAALAALVTAAGPTLLVVARDCAPAGCALVDVRHGATGHALSDGTELRAVVAAMGDWALGATLIRALIQRGATRIEVDPDDVVVADRDQRRVGTMLLRGAQRPGDGMGVQWLIQPLVRALAPSFAHVGLSDRHVAAVAGFAGIGGAVAAAWGYARLGLAMVVIASFIVSIAAMLGRAVGFGSGRRASAIVQVASVVAQLGVTLQLALGSGQWGYLAVGALALIAAALGQLARPLLPAAQRRWLADAPWSAVVLLVGVATNAPLAALMLLAGHAAAGLAYTIHKAVRQGLAAR